MKEKRAVFIGHNCEDNTAFTRMIQGIMDRIG